MPNKTKLHFARFEFKYILPNKLRHEVEGQLGFFLEFDPFVAATPHHKYFVRSLYFDDPVYTAYHEKIDGMRTRSKFRVRTYTASPASAAPYFLEIKGRHNNLVFKHRVQLDPEPGPVTERGQGLVGRMLGQRNPSDPVLHQFEYQLYRRRLRPVALIDYFRRPYTSKYDPEFRITFDEQLTATAADSLFPSPRERSRLVMPGYSIIEVKFRYHLPAWFHRIVQSYELRRVSVSKICRGLEALDLVDDLS